MADRLNPTGSPLTTANSPAKYVEDGGLSETLNYENSIDKDEQIIQLRYEVQELKNRVRELEYQQSTMTPMVSNQLIPPVFAKPPTMLPPSEMIPQQTQSQFVYQYHSPMMYPCQFPVLPLPEPQKVLRKKKKKKKTQSGVRLEERIPFCCSCRVGHDGQCSIHTRRCIRCGIIGHIMENCAYVTDVCWNCHREGHRSGQCPFPKMSSVGAGSVGESSAMGRKRKDPFTFEGQALQMPIDLTTDNDDTITGMFS